MAASFPAPKPKPRYQIKFLLGAVVIIGVIAYLIYFGLTNTSQYALDVSELQTKGAAAVGQGVRVIGNLDQKSIKQDIPANKISFVITDPDGAHRLPVSYNGVVPDTFDHATEVIAEGKLNNDGSFSASLVLAKCPSKYDAATNQPADYQWYNGKDISNVQGPAQ